LNVGVREMAHRCIKAEEAQVEALRRDYPLIPERVDTETREHDYGVPNHANDDPVDMYFDSRIHVLRLMRLSWSVGQYWLFEQLEKERQGASAQLAYALELRAQKTGQPG
jgi:hypothetical protein